MRVLCPNRRGMRLGGGVNQTVCHCQAIASSSKGDVRINIKNLSALHVKRSAIGQLNVFNSAQVFENFVHRDNWDDELFGLAGGGFKKLSALAAIKHLKPA